MVWRIWSGVFVVYLSAKCSRTYWLDFRLLLEGPGLASGLTSLATCFRIDARDLVIFKPETPVWWQWKNRACLGTKLKIIITTVSNFHIAEITCNMLCKMRRHPSYITEEIRNILNWSSIPRELWPGWRQRDRVIIRRYPISKIMVANFGMHLR